MVDTTVIGLFFFIAAIIMLMLPQTREKKASSILFAIMFSVSLAGMIFIAIDALSLFPAMQFVFWKEWILSYNNAWGLSISILILIALAITAAAFYGKGRKEIVATGMLAMLLWGIFALYPILEVI